MAPRNIREEDAFAEALRGLIEKCPRAEDWWVLGWSWRMVRDPVTDAYLVPGSDPPTYMLKTEGYEDYDAPPACTFLYRFDDEYLYMLDMKVTWTTTL